MKKTNKFIFLFILGIIFQSSSYAQNTLLPLNEYLTKQDIKSFATKEYVLLRCSASFNFIAVLLDENGADGKPSNEAAIMMVYAASLARQLNNAERQIKQSEEEIQNTMIKISKNLFSKYSEDGNNNYLNTGSYFEDTYIEHDITYCQSVNSDIETFMTK